MPHDFCENFDTPTTSYGPASKQREKRANGIYINLIQYRRIYHEKQQISTESNCPYTRVPVEEDASEKPLLPVRIFREAYVYDPVYRN